MPISEAEFQRQVLQLAKLCGWRRAHFRPGLTQSGRWVTPVQGDGQGFPDLVLVHPGRGLLLFVELKTDKGRETTEQRAWLEALARAGARAETWRPRDWPHIERVLKGEA